MRHARREPGHRAVLLLPQLLLVFTGVALALWGPQGRIPLSERGRFWIGVGGLVLALVVALGVPEIRPLLPPLVMKPGRLTPFAITVAGILNGVPALAALVWLFGLAGFLIHPFRYGVSWYVAGFARPVGLGVILLGLARAPETRRGAS